MMTPFLHSEEEAHPLPAIGMSDSLGEVLFRVQLCCITAGSHYLLILLCLPAGPGALVELSFDPDACADWEGSW